LRELISASSSLNPMYGQFLCVRASTLPLSPPEQRNYKEAEVYLLRFQQCMTRAMTLIKMYFVGSLRALTQDVSRRLFEQVPFCNDSSTCFPGYLSVYRMSPTPHNCIFFTHASPLWLGSLHLSSEN
jgi:hypothetical protein